MLADYQIAEQVRIHKMIEPFSAGDSNGRVSFGLTSVGYDARLGKNFYIALPAPPNEHYKTIGPATHDGVFTGEAFERKMIRLPPQTMCLAHTLEFFKIPSNICATVVGKSTWARLGLKLEVTPLEPEWEGQITLELFNAGFAPLELREGDGICQVQFHEINLPHVTYAGKHGKYQGQTGITFAKRSKESEDES